MKNQIDSNVYNSAELSLSLRVRGETLNVFLHDDAVYGLSVSPVNDNVFASSADDGRVLIWDTREPPHGGMHNLSLTVFLFAEDQSVQYFACLILPLTVCTVIGFFGLIRLLFN